MRSALISDITQRRLCNSVPTYRDNPLVPPAKVKQSIGFVNGRCSVQCKKKKLPSLFSNNTSVFLGTVVAQWLGCCATNRKVVGSIAAGVTGIYH